MVRIGRRTVAVATALLCIGTIGGAHAQAPDVHLIGAIHEHSAYSDGYPGSRPASYYESGKGFGLDFLGGGEHSDNTRLPNAFSDYCLSPEIASCALSDQQNPADSLRKWEATLEQARSASVAGAFTGFRGFEWSSDRYGHINVYFSRNDTNAKIDGGYATMKTFYQWLQTPASLGGSADGIATFNHPGDKKLSDSDPEKNWNDFAYVPEVDEQMVGLEVYNGTKDFASRGYYTRALDRGWHVGAVGAEDKGHDRADRWGDVRYAKTVVIEAGGGIACVDSADLTCAEQRLAAAMRARNTYAVLDNAIRIDMHADGALMGARLVRAPGAGFTLTANVTPAAGRLQVVSNSGVVVADFAGSSITYNGTGQPVERYYFLRVLNASGLPVAYSSPVWVHP